MMIGQLSARARGAALLVWRNDECRAPGARLSLLQLEIVRQRDVRHGVLALRSVQPGRRRPLDDAAHEQILSHRVGEARGRVHAGAAAVRIDAAVLGPVESGRADLRLEGSDEPAALQERPPRSGGGEERVAVVEAARVGRVEPSLDVGEQRPRTRSVRVGETDRLIPAAGAELGVLVRSVFSLDDAAVGAGRHLQRSEEREGVSGLDARAEQLEAGAHRGVAEALRGVVDAKGAQLTLHRKVGNFGLQHEAVDRRVLRAQEDSILPLALGFDAGAGLLVQDAILQREPEAAAARAIEPEGRGGRIAAADGTRESRMDCEERDSEERDETDEQRAHGKASKNRKTRTATALSEGRTCRRQASGGGVSTSITGESGRPGTGIATGAGKGSGEAGPASGGTKARIGVGEAISPAPPHVFMQGTSDAIWRCCSQTR